jgi:hypothetical protein
MDMLVGYSNWYSNENRKINLKIVINSIGFKFRLPRPTKYEARQNPPSAGFVASGVWKIAEDCCGVLSTHAHIGDLSAASSPALCRPLEIPDRLTDAWSD